jgi:hypothetical protein
MDSTDSHFMWLALVNASFVNAGVFLDKLTAKFLKKVSAFQAFFTL